MTPSERRRQTNALVKLLRDLADKIEDTATDTDQDPLHLLGKLHAVAPTVAQARTRYANLKGELAAKAKSEHTHEEIAEALGVSKPYVQQMVYRGRA